MNWQDLCREIQEYYHIEDKDTVIKVPFENIMELKNGCLTYKNHDGNMEEISLDDCVKNFQTEMGGALQNKSGEIIRAVGGRYFSSPVAFYEFFTDGHHVRFCMTLQPTLFKHFLRRIGAGVDSKAFSEFYALQKKLVSMGYSAIDLS